MICYETFCLTECTNNSAFPFNHIVFLRENMRNLKQLCTTLVLVLVLANASLAGDGIIYPWIVPPPPPPPTTGQVAPHDSAMPELAAEITLSFVRTMLTLF